MFLITLAVGGFTAYQGYAFTALLFGVWTGLIYAAEAENEDEIA